MSACIVKLKTDCSERCYSDSEDSGAIMNQWNGPNTDESLPDYLSDYESSTGHRSSSLQSLSSNENWLLSSYEDPAKGTRSPVSCASNSPNLNERSCFLNMSLKYNFHQESLDVTVINITNPPKKKSASKGLFIITQLFLSNKRGKLEDFNSLHKTEVKSYSTNILFNEKFKYESLRTDELQAISMRLSLCVHDTFSRAHLLGEFIVNFNEVTFDPTQSSELQRRLVQVNFGQSLSDLYFTAMTI